MNHGAAVKELELSFYNKETPLFTIYPYSGNLIRVPTATQ